MDNPRSLHDLRRFWEAIALGQPAAPGDLDPDLAALVQRLHATPDVPPPDPSFASHLREQLMHATTAPVLPASAPPNGRLPDSLAPGLFPPLVAPRRAGRAWPIARVAIVLLLLAAIIGAYVFTQRTRPVPTFTPAISTPAPAGAMQDWPMYRANPERSGVSGGAGPVGSPVTLWTYHADGPVSRSPAVADGVAYLQNGDGQVTALDTASGEVLWQNATSLRSWSAVLAIMMPPVSVCHQLSWIGRPSVSTPHHTASGLSGSPTLAIKRRSGKRLPSKRPGPAFISMRIAVGAVYQTLTRSSAKMANQRAVSKSAASTMLVAPMTSGARMP